MQQKQRNSCARVSPFLCMSCLLAKELLKVNQHGGSNCRPTAADSAHLVFWGFMRKTASKILLCKGGLCCVQHWQRRISRELAIAGVQGL